MTDSEIVTLLLAIYGAALSTWLAIREIRKDKQNVKVSCTYGLVPTGNGDDMMKFLVVEVVNRGPRPIQIVSAGLMRSDRMQWFQLSNRLGKIQQQYMLQDKDRAEYMYDWEEIVKSARECREQGLRITKAFVRDSEGNTFTCQLPRNFDRDALK